MDSIFSEMSFDFEIGTESKETDIKVNTEPIQLNLDSCLDSIKKEKTPLKNIGVIHRAEVKTTNDFIKVVQDNENTKLQNEIKRVKNANPEFPYIKSQLMTNAEGQLFHFMMNNLDFKDKVVIFPKVRLADLIELDPKLSLDKNYFYKIAYKHVDYVICDKDTLEVICVVELDDFYHEKDEKKERDLFVMQALYTVGIDVIRIRVPIRTICKDDLDFLDNKINTVLAPPCPYCGIKMTPKKSMNKSNKGHRFFSCPNFLNGCRYTINIDQGGEKLP